LDDHFVSWFGEQAKVLRSPFHGVRFGVVGTLGQQIANDALAKGFLIENMRREDHTAVSGQPLIGERHPDARSGVVGVNVQAHRWLRLRLRQRT